MSDDLISAMRRAFSEVISADRFAPVATVHHPKCEAVTTNDAARCNCGGVRFPVRAVSPADTTEAG